MPSRSRTCCRVGSASAPALTQEFLFLCEVDILAQDKAVTTGPTRQVTPMDVVCGAAATD